MNDDRNRYQIARKDAHNCFVESLSDAFNIGRIHFNFYSYDPNRPAGNRQTVNVHIYIEADEVLDLCQKLTGGELRYMWQNRKNSGDGTPLYQCIGGTSADKLKKLGRARPDGKSISRTAQLVCGKKNDFLFVADSGPGETDTKGLIVPQFGKNPENHVAVSMTWSTFTELLLITKTHYEAWLAAWYMRKTEE